MNSLTLERTVVTRQKPRHAQEHQTELLDREKLWHETVAIKLTGLHKGASWRNYLRCHNESVYRTCCDCGKTTTLPYQCSLKWCPICTPRLAFKRRKSIELWAHHITQPKHVVLTVRNSPILTRSYVRRFCQNLLKLRRSKLFAAVKGGCFSLEVTNESKGWHLHAHMLLDVRWIDSGELARKWATIVGQEFAIVKIKDCRRGDYLREVTKYAVKGSDLAKWEGQQILEFIKAMQGRRTFIAFGTLAEHRQEVQRAINAKNGPRICECGCSHFEHDTDETALLRQLRREGKL